MNERELAQRIQRFSCGAEDRAYQWLGAHRDARTGTVTFRTWAPHALAVSVAGLCGDWEQGVAMRPLTGGIWETTVQTVPLYARYKYRIVAPDGETFLKCDPYAFHAETRPATASQVYDPAAYTWHDGEWMRQRNAGYDRPLNIYEVHLGSWKRDEEGRFYTYRRLADELVPYVRDMGYTHVEFLPVMEHPLDASWGYQCTGYFAPTSRFGDPSGLQSLIDRFHQAGIGVILDWVPAHFSRDDWGLARFDGSWLYEDSNIRRRERPDWGTYVFDFGKPQVKSFLLSSARFWMEQYHADGFRIDAVASMLYLDFGREDGQWEPNSMGGRENLEAISFLRDLNRAVVAAYPQALMMAEESSAWPRVTKPVHEDGLGFNYKWNMGWMNDILAYFREDPFFRQYHHDKLTFSLTYAFSENYVLPLSHDEVVHLKHSLLEKMPGDPAQRMAGLRTLLAYMMTHPGKKLLFMGGELAQEKEWNEDTALSWELLEDPQHRQMQDFVRALNRFYRETPPLWENDGDWTGFRWIACDNAAQNVICFRRIGRDGREVIVMCNFAPVTRECYRFGMPGSGICRVTFTTDAPAFGGTGTCIFADGSAGMPPPPQCQPIPWDGLPWSASMTVPPLSVTCLDYLPSRKPHTVSR